MLMPSDYQHKHQNGLDSSTESAIKYLRYAEFCNRADYIQCPVTENISMLRNFKNIQDSMRSVFFVYSS